MSAVIQFHQLTTELIRLLENTDVDRDDKIAKVEELLNQRETLIEEIKPPYTPEELEKGKEVTLLNTKLDQLLKREKGAVQRDIKDLQNKKESNTKYVNPYQSLSTDGMFYDRRK
ncbi:flagellar protein FliT [Mesobacillus subterraneus]|uniref:Flagellar protein FliT n=1 Tax=Mesobacillus subterraneus TaxID=285983 RepID=A0A3R9FU68_9BACI|nr:flagellar protein FliT [Mesobacillus subterraneus]RSD25192.1 flagellar protein FliT [Mesobacillus subterraneus]